MKSLIKMYAIIVIAFFSMFLVSCSKDLQDDNNKLLPAISNASVSNITATRATITAEITSKGETDLTEQGVCYDTMPNPTVSKSKLKSDSIKVGTFSLQLKGLKPNTKYYARAYATNSKGTGYSNEINFSIAPVKIGDLYGGGIVFYIDVSGQHGLISALAGNNHSAPWGCEGVSVPGLKTEIGSGQANTNAIIAACTTADNAAKWCDDLKDNGYSDWYLPSKDELAEMFKYRDKIGFNATARWSSSEADANTAFAHGFDPAGSLTTANKNTVQGVRAIRAF